MQQDPNNLIWIDLEMTGLDTVNDRILEIATAITDTQLRLIAEGPVFTIYQPPNILAAMGEWCQQQHQKSGLLARVRKQGVSLSVAEQGSLAFLAKYVPKGISPMCGNTICQDRRFMHREMPQLEAYFHYRHLDVSTVKELALRWLPSLPRFEKKLKHLAMDDIKDSIEELKYYREHCFKIKK